MPAGLADGAGPPRHLAIIMDGNGRWAEARHLPRTVGHQAGVRAVRRVVELCLRRQISVLTLFAFSSENWNRPPQEVARLMDLFVRALGREVDTLHRNGVRLRFIGDATAFAPELRQAMERVSTQTARNDKLALNVALNYGGRWDIAQAARRAAQDFLAQGRSLDELDEAELSRYFALADLPAPDLFIRTGGEMRISNFLLWQLAYTELVFQEVLWPAFKAEHLDQALLAYARRERRFGRTGQQVREQIHA